jgi:hypothetical protein
MGAYFPAEQTKYSLRVVFYFSIGQNYFPEAALLFLILQRSIGVGNIKILINKAGVTHIRYVVTNTKDILDKVLAYFSLLYGQKRVDSVKLNRIFSLYKSLSYNFDMCLASELINLVYSLNPDGKKRIVSLDENIELIIFIFMLKLFLHLQLKKLWNLTFIF